MIGLFSFDPMRTVRFTLKAMNYSDYLQIDYRMIHVVYDISYKSKVGNMLRLIKIYNLASITFVNMISLPSLNSTSPN